MKLFNKILLLFVASALIFTSCDKAEDLSLFNAGTASVLTSSSLIVAPTATDSNNVAVTFSWTSPKYATDSANMKYVLQIDSAGRNFSKAVSKTISGALSYRYIAKELNAILLAYGFAFNTPYDVEARVISSYANNNESYTSNTIKFKVTPYKIPPKVGLPASGKLFMVGDATAGGWGNPVPVPTQELSRIDETTFGGVFQLIAGKTYFLLTVNGSWDTKFGGTGNNNSNNTDGDNFKFGGSDLKAPGVTGMYKVIFDFQTGKFTTTAYTGTLPSALFIVGDATPGGWSNPVPALSQQFTRVNSSLFELTIPLFANKTFLLLPVNGSWTNKYGGMGNNNTNNVSTDDIRYNGSDLKAPAENAIYRISINFATGTAVDASGRMTVVKQ